MPWIKEDIVDQREKFVLESIHFKGSFTELCRKYNVSTKTGYKYQKRFFLQGTQGLKDQSRRPKTSPSKLDESVVLGIVKCKVNKKHWGPKKIRENFHDNNPTLPIPSLSSVERILKAAGLIEKKKRRKNTNKVQLVNHITPKEPNDLWTVDFKGWWYTSKKKKVNPLTVKDAFTHFLLCIESMTKADSEHVKSVFIELFKKYGLPKAIKSDNGPPFASPSSQMGLSQLSVWWLALGIKVHRIQPGKPQQNGSHERMHRDMARELESRVFGSVESYQREFDKWKDEYNKERPHESLGMKKPAQLYKKSPRKYTDQSTEFEYPTGYHSRKVMFRGDLSFQNRRWFIGRPFMFYTVGIYWDIKMKVHQVYLGSMKMGHLDPETLSMIPNETIFKIR